MSAGFLLDSYAARSCAVKTHNRFDATVPPQPASDESLPEVFAGGAEHARQMLDALADAVPATGIVVNDTMPGYVPPVGASAGTGIGPLSSGSAISFS